MTEYGELDPIESDIVIKDTGHLGSESIAFCDGKVIAHAKADQDIYKMVKDWMTANEWYPNVFILSDHGNYHLTSV